MPAPLAHGIALAGRLHFYDLGPEVRQELATEWPGEQAPHLHDPHPLQRRMSPVTRLAHLGCPPLGRSRTPVLVILVAYLKATVTRGQACVKYPGTRKLPRDAHL